MKSHLMNNRINSLKPLEPDCFRIDLLIPPMQTLNPRFIMDIIAFNHLHIKPFLLCWALITTGICPVLLLKWKYDTSIYYKLVNLFCSRQLSLLNQGIQVPYFLCIYLPQITVLFVTRRYPLRVPTTPLPQLSLRPNRTSKFGGPSHDM